MVPITAALLHKFDLHYLLEDNRTLGGTYHCHTTTSSLLTMGMSRPHRSERGSPRRTRAAGPV